MIGLLTLAALAAAPADRALTHVQPLAHAEAPFHAVRTTPFSGGDRVRVAQTVRGLPVWGSTMVVVLDPDGSVKRTVGMPVVPPELESPVFTADAAMARVDGLMPGDGELFAPRAELGVLARDSGARLAWRVEVSRNAPLAAWHAWVDAETGVILGIAPSLWTARGLVYETNPEQGEPVEVDLGPVGDTLSGDYASAVSCVDWSEADTTCRETAQFAVADGNGDFFFDADDGLSEDPFAEVMMYHHLDVIGRWFEQLGFRHDRLSSQQQMQAVANIDYANAFYGDADGDGVPEVAFGKTVFGNFAYDADVIYHEYSHSVFNELVQPVFSRADAYGLDGAPGGLNEGTADLFAMAYTGDAKVGEYGGRAFGLDGPVRNLGPDKSCPHDIYNQTHTDGQIWASLGWNLIEDPLLGGDLVGELVVGAVAEFPSDVSWKQAGKALRNSADDLLAAGRIDAEQHAAIIAHGEASGVIGCGRVIPLEEVESSRQQVFAFGDDGTPLATQFSLDAPEGTTELVFRIDEKIELQGALTANVYVRRDDFVRHELIDLGYFQIATPTDFDAIEAGIKRKSFEWVLDASSEPPLEPGATYYFSVAIGAPDGFGIGEVVVSGDSTIVPPVEPEALASAQGEESAAGCGCSSGHSAAGWLALPLLILGLRRR